VVVCHASTTRQMSIDAQHLVSFPWGDARAAPMIHSITVNGEE